MQDHLISVVPKEFKFPVDGQWLCVRVFPLQNPKRGEFRIRLKKNKTAGELALLLEELADLNVLTKDVANGFYLIDYRSFIAKAFLEEDNEEKKRNTL